MPQLKPPPQPPSSSNFGASAKPLIDTTRAAPLIDDAAFNSVKEALDKLKAPPPTEFAPPPDPRVPQADPRGWESRDRDDRRYDDRDDRYHDRRRDRYDDDRRDHHRGDYDDRKRIENTLKILLKLKIL